MGITCDYRITVNIRHDERYNKDVDLNLHGLIVNIPSHLITSSPFMRAGLSF